MPKVVHLIPYDGIGGVESAARSMVVAGSKDLGFDIFYIFPKVSPDKQRFLTCNPYYLLRAMWSLFFDTPDVLIVSLWRSCIVGVFLKLFRRNLKLVLFLHLPTDVHRLDRLFTKAAARFALQIWADSDATLKQRLPGIPSDKTRVISFVTKRFECLEENSVEPKFIFWGRIHPQKGLDRALDIFSAVRREYPVARFVIIGPDGGEKKRINSLICEMNLSSSVDILDGMGFDGIIHHARESSFYLQTSLQEGMAMSVVEAMQLGLVPVVTPVGEINHYCKRGENAILVETNSGAVNEIISVLNDQNKYFSLRRKAIKTWLEKPLYSESVLNVCWEVIHL